MIQNDDHRVDTFPIVVPISTSEVQEMISAIVCSLYASLAFLHFLPPGKTRGRSSGASPPKDCLALFCFSLRSITTFILSSSWWLCLPPYVFCVDLFKYRQRVKLSGLMCIWDHIGKQHWLICEAFWREVCNDARDLGWIELWYYLFECTRGWFSNKTN